MNEQTDSRFHDFVPTEKSRKGEILMHLDYAHERQSRRDFYQWLSNYQFFIKKFTKTRLLKIHDEYHKEVAE